METWYFCGRGVSGGDVEGTWEQGTLKRSVALYRVYTAFLYWHGSEYNCRPSTLMGLRMSELSAIFS
jgi:hypothetical protein